MSSIYAAQEQQAKNEHMLTGALWKTALPIPTAIPEY